MSVVRSGYQDHVFEYRLQPIVRIRDSQPFSFELLLGRDRCPDMTSGQWIAWYEWLPMVALRHPGKTMFVNVDGPHLLDPSVMSALIAMRRRVESAGFGGHIVLEWTERGTEQDVEGALDLILELQSMGFQIAVDDVGSGADGIGRICLVRPKYAKIAHSLFHGLRSLSDIERLTRLRLSLEAFGCSVILEGVENGYPDLAVFEGSQPPGFQ